MSAIPALSNVYEWQSRMCIVNTSAPLSGSRECEDNVHVQAARASRPCKPPVHSLSRDTAVVSDGESLL